MRAGKLRNRITIQREVKTSNGSGGFTSAWQSFASNLPADVAPMTGRELFQAQQVSDRTSHTVTLRYLSGVTSAMRVLFGTRILTITSAINVDERQRQLTLVCEELRS